MNLATLISSNPSNPPIKPLIRNNWNIIQNIDEFKKIFKDKPLVGYKRLFNLRDLITKASITYPPTEKTENKQKKSVQSVPD